MFIAYRTVENTSSISFLYDVPVKSINGLGFAFNRGANFNGPNLISLKPSGTIPDGTPDGMKYYVYQFIIFDDDFTVNLDVQKPKSVGGLYLAPLAYPAYIRNNPQSIRLITLTSPKVSTTDVMDYLVDDIVKGFTFGIRTTDSHGSSQRIRFSIAYELSLAA